MIALIKENNQNKTMNELGMQKILEASEKFFGTEEDPDQIPICQASAEKLISIHKDTLTWKSDEQGNLAAWLVVIPTSVYTMNKFLSGEITEKELLDVAAEEKEFEALYMCGVFVMPEHRRQGYAKELILEAIKNIPNADKAVLYTWIYSEEGQKLTDWFIKQTGREVKLKK